MALFKNQNYGNFLSENAIHHHNPAYPAYRSGRRQASLARYKNLVAPINEVKK